MSPLILIAFVTVASARDYSYTLNIPRASDLDTAASSYNPGPQSSSYSSGSHSSISFGRPSYQPEPYQQPSYQPEPYQQSYQPEPYQQSYQPEPYQQSYQPEPYQQPEYNNYETSRYQPYNRPLPRQYSGIEGAASALIESRVPSSQRVGGEKIAIDYFRYPVRKADRDYVYDAEKYHQDGYPSHLVKPGHIFRGDLPHVPKYNFRDSVKGSATKLDKAGLQGLSGEILDDLAVAFQRIGSRRP